MKKIYKFLFLFLLPFTSIAQSNYKPGYVVTLKGDTLHGFIDFREWDSNPSSINFKTAADDRKPTKLTTDEISFFNINNADSYLRYAGKISMDRTDANHISSGRDIRYKTAVVFLKVLQKGERVTLFSYSDDLKTRFYVAEHSEQLPAELVYREYYTTDVSYNSGDRSRSVSENTYMNQLFALAQKYNMLTNSLQWDIEHLSYSEPNLLKIVSQINGISKSEYENKYNKGTKLNLVAGAALNINTTNPSGAYLAAGGKVYTSFLPAISFGMNVFANPNTGKLVFRVELSLAEKDSHDRHGTPFLDVSDDRCCTPRREPLCSALPRKDLVRQGRHFHAVQDHRRR